MLKRFILLAFLLAAPAFGALTCTYEPLTGLLLCVPSTSAGSSSVTVAAAAAGDAEVVKQGIGSTINQRGLTAGVGVVLTE
ncbi:MAG TPA: hypothetical protein VFB63_11325, partial [Bryobacteraceae bacterium]|nr:hypothetical protein [Bryobacteraceae bacterium]